MDKKYFSFKIQICKMSMLKAKDNMRLNFKNRHTFEFALYTFLNFQAFFKRMYVKLDQEPLRKI